MDAIREPELYARTPTTCSVFNPLEPNALGPRLSLTRPAIDHPAFSSHLATIVFHKEQEYLAVDGHEPNACWIYH